MSTPLTYVVISSKIKKGKKNIYISHTTVVPEKSEHFISSYISVLFDTQETNNFINITVEFYYILSVN